MKGFTEMNKSYILSLRSDAESERFAETYWTVEDLRSLLNDFDPETSIRFSDADLLGAMRAFAKQFTDRVTEFGNEALLDMFQTWEKNAPRHEGTAFHSARRSTCTRGQRR